MASLRSRGVTRFLDLNKINKRHHPDDLNEDEIASGSEPDDDADDMQPPTRRQRTTYTTVPEDELTFEEVIAEIDRQLEGQPDGTDSISMAPTSPRMLKLQNFQDKHNHWHFLHQLT